MDQPLSPVFYIGTIHVGEIEGASCLNMGNNWPTNFTSHKKHNQGFGNVRGSENDLRSVRALLNDPDTYDSLNLRDSELPDWLESLAEQLQADPDEATADEGADPERSGVR